jgi:hypothetical protein
MTTLFDKASATFSPCKKYRYTLSREWDTDTPPVVFVMLNPSTADADKDDPTIRRCVAFAKAWGAGGIVVVNLFALRSTDPDALRTASHPVSEFGMLSASANDDAILTATAGRRIIVAWGTKGRLMGRDRAVMRLLKGRAVECLRKTKDGHPEHPLYVPGTIKPLPFGSEVSL